MARRTRLIRSALVAVAALIALAGTGETPPVDGAEETAIIAAGNIGDCTSDGDEATAAIVAQLDGIVATLGDTTYPAGREESFADCYDPTWGPFIDRTRPVLGNHDYGTADAAAYFAYFGDRGGEPGKGWYSYSVGSWHVVGLNSVCDEVGCGTGSEQLEWLANDLQSSNADCLLAYWHHPRFSSGSIGSDARMSPAWRMLQEAGAEVVLSGHAHHYERLAPQDDRGTQRADGIRQFVVGTGGTHLHPVGSVLLNSEAIVAERHGVLHLELEPEAYRWRFLAVGEAAPLDEGHNECRPRPVQTGRMFRALAPVLIIIPLGFVALVVLLVRLSHFRVN